MNAQNLVAGRSAPRSQFVTDDPVEILRYARESFKDGVPVALVTLVDIRGGAARPLGAQMTVRIDGLYCGFVSGGCTEAAVAFEAMEALNIGHDRFLQLGEGSPFFDIVLPCGGGIQLSIHVIRQIETINDVLGQLARRREAGLLYHPGAEAISCRSSGQTGWQPGGFLRIYRPSTRLIVSGNALEANAVAQVARAVGYDVDLVGKSFERNVSDVSPDKYSAFVLLNHDLDAELPALEAALKSPAFYIGALGSRRTHDRRRQALARLGYGEAEISRIKAPIGIFDRARDASSLALSVTADIAARVAADVSES
ncbi:XdhC family protein [Rhizobium cauense]|uniref:XdhC family protein n=1 Tax=Rhizobium cauense TaxID=1166683 RepID=UPI001C6DE5C9|nr:XdhC family protein [Rhizobium cauense]MBW9118178.1 XdhC family protein [Rhizobium cauense]